MGERASELREFADALDKDRGHSKSYVTIVMRQAADDLDRLAAVETERDQEHERAETRAAETLKFMEAAAVEFVRANNAEADLVAVRAEHDEARQALIDCAELAGADGEAVEAARSGALKFPSIEVFALNAVQVLKNDAEEDAPVAARPETDAR